MAGGPWREISQRGTEAIIGTGGQWREGLERDRNERAVRREEDCRKRSRSADGGRSGNNDGHEGVEREVGCRWEGEPSSDISWPTIAALHAEPQTSLTIVGAARNIQLRYGSADIWIDQLTVVVV